MYIYIYIYKYIHIYICINIYRLLREARARVLPVRMQLPFQDIQRRLGHVERFARVIVQLVRHERAAAEHAYRAVA